MPKESSHNIDSLKLGLIGNVTKNVSFPCSTFQRKIKVFWLQETKKVDIKAQY